MKTKLSPWWDENTKPVNEGVYETILVGDSGYLIFDGWSYWTGKRWNDSCSSKKTASTCQRIGGQKKKWRGIVK